MIGNVGLISGLKSRPCDVSPVIDPVEVDVPRGRDQVSALRAGNHPWKLKKTIKKSFRWRGQNILGNTEGWHNRKGFLLPLRAVLVHVTTVETLKGRQILCQSWNVVSSREWLLSPDTISY